jgi:hypothetical protein
MVGIPYPTTYEKLACSMSEKLEKNDIDENV